MDKNRTRVVTVMPSGVTHGLHYDDMDLGFLGHKTITRASEILFDDAAQTFYIELPQLSHGVRQPPFLRGFAGYDQARAFEVQLLESCRLNDIEPAYEAGFYRLGYLVRGRFNSGDIQAFRADPKEQPLAATTT